MPASFLSNVAAKQIHIRMDPVPRNLAESQRILHALKKFGEVVYFYNLRYEPSLKLRNSGRTILAIFESEESVDSAIAASPLTVPLSDDPHPSLPSSPSPSSKTTTPKPYRNNSRPNEPRTSIQCNINRSTHDHADALRQNPYYNSFSLTSNTLEYHDLTRKDGSGGVPLREFADCFTRRKKATPFRLQNRVLEENRGMGADSLMGLWREGVEKERKGTEKEEGKV